MSTTTEPVRPVAPSSDAARQSATDTPSPAACLNCGAPLGGHFCSQCGQRDIPPYPSVRELVQDAAEEIAGWDGRLASTLRALILHPGRLTLEWLEGRRARYVSPLRLYLAASLVYFLLAHAAPVVKTDDGKVILGGMQVRTTTTPAVGDTAAASRPERLANTVGDAMRSGQPLSLEAQEKAKREIARAPAVLRPLMRRMATDPGGLQRALGEAMPRLIFALVPVYAAIIALFYRRRKFPEHLYFSVHLSAFIFLTMALAEIAKFTKSAGVTIAVGAVSFCWMMAYTVIAFRRIYGGSLVATVAKQAGIIVLYMAASLVAFVLTIFFLSLFG